MNHYDTLELLAIALVAAFSGDATPPNPQAVSAGPAPLHATPPAAAAPVLRASETVH